MHKGPSVVFLTLYESELGEYLILNVVIRACGPIHMDTSKYSVVRMSLFRFIN